MERRNDFKFSPFISVFKRTGLRLFFSMVYGLWGCGGKGRLQMIKYYCDLCTSETKDQTRSWEVKGNKKIYQGNNSLVPLVCLSVDFNYVMPVTGGNDSEQHICVNCALDIIEKLRTKPTLAREQ